MNEDIEYVLQWARAQCGNDIWSPGVTIAKLDSGLWYASLVRWPTAEQRVVMKKAHGWTMERVLSRLRSKVCYANEIKSLALDVEFTT